MTAPAPLLADQFPVQGVRFANGRTGHRTRRPEDERWWDLLEAACGKSGYLANGYVVGGVRDCPRCAEVVAPQAA